MAQLVPPPTTSTTTMVFLPPVDTSSSSSSSSTSSSVDAAVRDRFSPAASPMTTRLRKTEPAKNPQGKYQEACRLLNGNKLGEARALFAAIISDLLSTEPNWPLLADCKIGIGYTYPEGSVERQQLAMEAKKDLDSMYDKSSSWDALDIEQKAAKYKKMKTFLEKLQRLIPSVQASFAVGIEIKIQDCNRHIPLLSLFYDNLDQGIQRFNAGQLDQARQLFEYALRMIKEHSGPDYLLAGALGTMHLASTYPPGDEFNINFLTALSGAFAAYKQKEKLFTNEKTKAAALSLFHKLFNGLSQLFPTDPVDSQIIEKLADCQRQLASLKQAGKPDSRKTPPGPKVTPTPVNDSWKPVKIFVAFAIAATILVGAAAVLGRRFIIRLN